MLTHWGRAKMADISQTTFSNVFSSMKMFEFRLKFHWSLLLSVQLTIFQHWFRKWLGADQATSHYLNQWWLDYRRIYASFGLNELRIDMDMDVGATYLMSFPQRSGQRSLYFLENKYEKQDHTYDCAMLPILQSPCITICLPVVLAMTHIKQTSAWVGFG